MARRLLVSSILLVCAAYPGSCNAMTAIQATRLDNAPRVIVMSAFDPEMKQLRSHTQITRTQVINGRKCYVGQLAGTDVVLVLSGMSMVNAAMMAQTAFDHFNALAIVFSGIAGGVNPNLEIGDVAVPAQWAEYQESVFARQTAEGWIVAEPFARRQGDYGMMFTQHVHVTRKSAQPDIEEERFWFPAAPTLLEVARGVVPQVRLSKCTAQGDCLTHEPKIVVGGNGVSGPSFVDNSKYRDWVWRTFQADALDMESAAIAHVAYTNDVPFIVFRSLSDLAGGGPDENEMGTFFQLAADNSATVVEAFLREWAKR